MFSKYCSKSRTQQADPQGYRYSSMRITSPRLANYYAKQAGMRTEAIRPRGCSLIVGRYRCCGARESSVILKLLSIIISVYRVAESNNVAKIYGTGNHTEAMGEASARAMVKIDESVNKQIETDELNPKRHPGIIKSRAMQLPEWIEKAMVEATADHPVKPLRKVAGILANYLKQRHPPLEKHEFVDKLTEVQELVSRKVDLSKLSNDEIDEFWKRNQYNVKIKLKQRVYAWVAVEYDAYKSLCYMLARGAQEYSVLYQIFNEIHLADKEFQPKALFDFGSGIGTVTWAASQFWITSLNEYYCVDSSGDMHRLAESIIANHPSKLKEVYFRQFLPSSARIKSDIVVSAFSLMELPNAQARLEVVLNLWMRTNNYLIIVEQGTNAGFRIVNEARDFVLDMSSKSLETDNPNPFHVFAPVSVLQMIHSGPDLSDQVWFVQSIRCVGSVQRQGNSRRLSSQPVSTENRYTNVPDTAIGGTNCLFKS
ncbi:ribosome assembly protein METTL17, mitochondrial isoform X3 [Neodiprion pinetum]|uniref:ribosome assembly protein METTL17, mitochondrial isoform X3 n=1 Tax=Neodiprion pinetum TaxID=441929 RepID=UPI001EE0B75E|nr:methyltransferase-like protein 17, mitochondrial isoform X2 [Neodiprion pinetum]